MISPSEIRVRTLSRDHIQLNQKFNFTEFIPGGLFNKVLICLRVLYSEFMYMWNV